MKKPPKPAAPDHAVLWRQMDEARSSSGITQFEGLEVMGALLLLWSHEYEQQKAAATAETVGTAEDEAVFRHVEDELSAVSPGQWHDWLRRRVVDALGERHGSVVRRWAETTRMSAEAVKMVVSFLPDRINLKSRAEFRIHIALLMAIGMEALEKEGRQGLSATPRALAEFVVDLLDPKPGDRIYNPGFGIGSLMMAAWLYLRSQVEQLAAPEQTHILSETFYGVELNPVFAFLTLVRLECAGLSRPNLEVGSVLNPPFASRFDVVLCDAPFGGKQHYLCADGRRVSASREAIFLDHVLTSLAPGGRAAMSVPSGLLARGGLERRLRERMGTSFRLEAVLELPAGAWPGTVSKANLLLIEHASPRLSVAFVGASVSQQFVKPLRDPGWEKVRLGVMFHDVVRTGKVRQAGGG